MHCAEEKGKANEQRRLAAAAISCATQIPVMVWASTKFVPASRLPPRVVRRCASMMKECGDNKWENWHMVSVGKA
jgi:hypothetical protein